MYFGNAELVEHLCRLSTNDNIHAILLGGPNQVGKGSLARLIAEKALGRPMQAVDTDVLIIDPGDSRKISVAQAQAAIRHLAIKPFSAKKKCLIINEAECLTKQASNALLVSLEEPPGASLIIITANKPAQLLNTVRSRCLNFNICRLADAQLKEELKKCFNDLSQEQLEQIVKLAHGLPGRAIRLIEDTQYLKKITNTRQNLSRWQAGDLNERFKIIKAYSKDREAAQLFINESAFSEEVAAKRGLLAAQRRLNNNVSPKAVLEALAMVK